MDECWGLNLIPWRVTCIIQKFYGIHLLMTEKCLNLITLIDDSPYIILISVRME
jgi:hypothetical protein